MRAKPKIVRPSAQSRLLLVTQAIASGTRTAEQLLGAMGVPRRTIYRDLDTIRAAGLHVAVAGVLHQGATHSLGVADVLR